MSRTQMNSSRLKHLKKRVVGGGGVFTCHVDTTLINSVDVSFRLSVKFLDRVLTFLGVMVAA